MSVLLALAALAAPASQHVEGQRAEAAASQAGPETTQSRPAAHAATQDETTELWFEVLRLRRSADLDAARERAQTLAEEDSLPAWFQRDIASLLATLARAQAAGEPEREELLGAWRAAHGAALAFDQGERERALELGSTAIRALERQLGPEHLECNVERVLQAWRVGHVRDAATWLERSEQALSGVDQAGYGEHPVHAMALGVAAYASMKSARSGEAWERMNAASDLWSAMDAPPDIYLPWHIQCANGLALLANARGDYERADAELSNAVLLARRFNGEDSQNYANLVGNLAEMLSERGEVARALPLLRESVARKTRLLPAGHPSLATGLHNLGVLLLTSGATSEAERILTAALDSSADAWGRNPQLVALLETLGQTRLAGGDLDAARVLLQRALELGERNFPDRPQDAHRRRLALAQVDVAAGRLDAAQQALVRLEQTAPGPSYDAARAEIAWRRGDLPEAEARAGAALALLEQESPEPAERKAQLETLLARVAARQARLEPALGRLERAAALYESARARRPLGVTRSTFAPQAFAPLLAAARVESADPNGAWRAAEEARGRTLFELLLAAGARQLDPGMADRLRMTHDALTGQEALAANPSASDEQRNQANALVHALNAELLRIQGELDALHPVAEGRAYTLATVQSALAPNEALVGWVFAELPGPAPRLWTWVLRAAGEVHWSAGVPVEDLAQRLTAWRGELAGGARSAFPPAQTTDTSRLRTELFGALDDPESRNDNDALTHLIAVPSAPILGVPLDLLVDGEFTVSQVPSGTILAWLRERPPVKARAALLVGDPPFRVEHLADAPEPPADPLPNSRAPQQRDLPMHPGALPRLPYSRTEVERIAKRIEASTRELVGSAANELAVRELALDEFRLLHFATHALVDDARPENSALVLSQVDLPDPVDAALRGAPPIDGLITAGEIAAGWQLDADLVVLSACETALGRAVPGEGYLGLAQAFFQAGSRSVLASLWSVDDRATARFMDAFYAAWLEGSSTKAEALQQARETLRNWRDENGRAPFAHPGTWGAFVLLGDAR